MLNKAGKKMLERALWEQEAASAAPAPRFIKTTVALWVSAVVNGMRAQAARRAR